MTSLLIEKPKITSKRTSTRHVLGTSYSLRCSERSTLADTLQCAA